MIIEKVLFHCKTSPTKVALSYRGKEITYGELADAIHDSSGLFRHSLIYKSLDPIGTIIAFLRAAKQRNPIAIVSESFEIDNLDQASQSSPIKDFSFGLITSGSTGKPKLIWKTNDNWEAAFENQSKVFGIGASDKIMILDALSYSANLNSAIHGLWCGASVHFESLAKAKDWSKTILSHGITSIFLVPSHWSLIVNQNVVFENVKSCLSCGEKLNATLARRILKTFPEGTLTEYYGAAELGHITYQQNHEIVEKPHSVGRAFPGVNLTVENQIIRVKSPYIAPAFRIEGTVGDMGAVDADGSLILLGRSGRMFNKRGLNVYAQEIEQAILSHSLVDAAVLREINKGFQIKLELLYTVKNGGVSLDERDLWELLNQKVEKAKHPHFLRQIEDIPRNNFGKIAIGQLSKKMDEEAVV